MTSVLLDMVRIKICPEQATRYLLALSQPLAQCSFPYKNAMACLIIALILAACLSPVIVQHDSSSKI
jgi:hypothetical protein